MSIISLFFVGAFKTKCVIKYKHTQSHMREREREASVSCDRPPIPCGARSNLSLVRPACGGVQALAYLLDASCIVCGRDRGW